jgi:hypothetical protein
MVTLEYGESYPFPLDITRMELLQERMKDLKRVIGVAHFITQGSESEIAIPVKNYETLWLCDYAVTHQGEQTTTKQILFDGYPTTPHIKDLFAPVQGRLKFLLAHGLPIAQTGGRQDRAYHLPKFASAELEYVEDPDIVKRLDDRYRLPSQLKAGASKIKDLTQHVKLSIEEYRLPSLAHDMNDVFPFQKRIRANCRHANPDLFVSNDVHDVMTAKMICRGCSVRAECLAFAQAAGHVGVWGGEYFPLETHISE